MVVRSKKCGTLHDFVCHPCAGAMHINKLRTILIRLLAVLLLKKLICLIIILWTPREIIIAVINDGPEKIVFQ